MSQRGIFNARVVGNRMLCAEHFCLTLAVNDFPATRPGQFVQLQCRPLETMASGEASPRIGAASDYLAPEDGRDSGQSAFIAARVIASSQTIACVWTGAGPGLWDVEGGRKPHQLPMPGDADFSEALPYLRRAFSIAGRRETAPGHAEFDIIHRVVGKGTRSLSRLEPGETLSVLGPLGNGFDVAKDKVALLVGGGVGVPPILYLAAVLAVQGGQAVAFIGAQRGDLIPLEGLFSGESALADGTPNANAPQLARLGIAAAITTDDGSYGMPGLVTGALEKYLSSRGPEERLRCVIYCCGPTPMMRAVAELAARFGVTCQVSLEQPMACGMGTCQSCVVKHRTGTDDGWRYRLTCADGPVFVAGNVVW